MRPVTEYTSISKIISKVIIRLKIPANTTDYFFIKDCVIEGAVKMGTSWDFIEDEAEITLDDNFCGCLPSNFVKLGVDNPCKAPITISRECNCDDECTCATSISLFPTYVIQNGKIIFNSDLGCTKIKINYTAVNTWENGEIRIPANNEDAIKSYAMYQWRKAEGMPAALWMDDKQNWINGKLAARGLSKLQDPQDKIRMFNIMNDTYATTRGIY